MREISNPFVVDIISGREEISGEVVPVPTAPKGGNVFVCAITTALQIMKTPKSKVDLLFI